MEIIFLNDLRSFKNRTIGIPFASSICFSSLVRDKAGLKFRERAAEERASASSTHRSRVRACSLRKRVVSATRAWATNFNDGINIDGAELPRVNNRMGRSEYRVFARARARARYLAREQIETPRQIDGIGSRDKRRVAAPRRVIRLVWYYK